MSRDRDTVTALTAVTEVAAGKGPARDSVLLGKYRVESTLGFGGMGLVVRAHNIQLDQKVAIKFLRDDIQLDDDALERFLREAKAAVRLKSEHVARIRDVGTLEDGRPYMVMELLEGLDLGKLLVDQESLEPQRAVDLILQACDAIAEAHSIGIVHRDIKPTNLFLTRRRDDSELLKVLDFGISKAQSGPEMSLTQTSSMLGTPAYMSPEQMRSARTVDARSDIWALGTVLYELVEGHAPFEASNFAELCVMVSTEPPTPMSKAPHLTPVIERCLEKSIEQRYQNVAELAADLEAYAEDAGRARRQVARIMRVLGKEGPASRDSTPIPMTRGSMARIPVTPSQTEGAPSAIYDIKPSFGVVKTILVLVVLFGVGIGGGLYATRTDEPANNSTNANEPAPPPDLPTEPASDVTAAPASIDASIPLAADAGIATTPTEPPPKHTGPATHTIKRTPPPRRPPPRKQPPPTPKVQPPPPPPPPPPVKKCDPLDNPKGCK